MALTACKECGHQISTEAKACPQCGAKVERTSFITKVVLVMILFSVAVSIFSSCSESRDAEEKAARENQRVATLTPEQRKQEDEQRAEREKAEQEAERERQADRQRETEENLGLRWRYEETSDDMSGKPVKNALLTSTNTFEFEFPYQGQQRAMIALRRHPRFGRDAMLQIDRGQFLCRVDGCAVRVRFDEGPPQTFSMVEPEDHSSTVLFFSNHDRFVSQLKKAKAVKIEANFFQEGGRVFLFNVAGLEW